MKSATSALLLIAVLVIAPQVSLAQDAKEQQESKFIYRSRTGGSGMADVTKVSVASKSEATTVASADSASSRARLAPEIAEEESVKRIPLARSGGSASATFNKIERQ